VLLRTLEGLNQQLQLPSQDCVPYVLKNVVVVGLDGPDIEGRVQGLATAVGLDWDQAVKLAAAQPSLLMLTSEHLKVKGSRGPGPVGTHSCRCNLYCETAFLMVSWFVVCAGKWCCNYSMFLRLWVLFCCCCYCCC
jgi:hypothetical protein